jgi:hypothetical protein
MSKYCGGLKAALYYLNRRQVCGKIRSAAQEFLENLFHKLKEGVLL